MQGKPENALHHYLNRVGLLRESVEKTIEAYTSYLEKKIECQKGNLLSCDASEYQPRLLETSRLLDELNIFLSTVSCWSGLPFECFPKQDNSPDPKILDVNSSDQNMKQYISIAEGLQESFKNYMQESQSLPSVEDAIQAANAMEERTDGRDESPNTLMGFIDDSGIDPRINDYKAESIM